MIFPRRRHWKHLGLILSLVWTCGCTHLTVVASPTADRAPAQKFYLTSYVWGLFNDQILPPANQLCPNTSLQSVSFHMSTIDTILATATLGIYVPHRAEVICLAQHL